MELPTGLTHIDYPCPDYAVVFTSVRREVEEDYKATNDLLHGIAKEMDGFLAMHSLRDGFGISISYWKDMESIDTWRKQAQHIVAKERGKNEWYTYYNVRICKVEKDYGMRKKE